MILKNFFIDWYTTNGRYFPWRAVDETAYKILVTEIFLKQTPASSVARIWNDFFYFYPDLYTLAIADKDSLYSLIKPLGFANQRAESLKATASWLIENYQGIIPSNIDSLLQIPSVGIYTAKAVSCFAFGKHVEIVDTNVLRFFSRYFAIKVAPDIRRNKTAWDLAKDILPLGHDGDGIARKHNYGILDFTAQVCKTRKPSCSNCLLASSCLSIQSIN
ncbi:hypothetical protein [Sporomusa termitida]|uniref:Adenine DNA glycosylase n=1 Tax=Sporomusa termitida TaxID=2377 RepID=A0A517DVG0_9FIRM|nr:hypothetical protein [Sporomusa termitida]QDR81321.1 Adenine DNA glycosylase [Sporomusa termitida]